MTLTVLPFSLVVFGTALGAATFGAALGAATFGTALRAAAFGVSFRVDLDSDTDVCVDAAVALIPEPDATAGSGILEYVLEAFGQVKSVCTETDFIDGREEA